MAGMKKVAKKPSNRVQNKGVLRYKNIIKSALNTGPKKIKKPRM